MPKKKVTISLDPSLDEFLSEISDRMLTSQIRSGVKEWRRMDRSKVISAILIAIKESGVDYFQARTTDELKNAIKARMRKS